MSIVIAETSLKLEPESAEGPVWQQLLAGSRASRN
jgi:hypothetical protein